MGKNCLIVFIYSETTVNWFCDNAKLEHPYLYSPPPPNLNLQISKCTDRLLLALDGRNCHCCRCAVRSGRKAFKKVLF